MALEHFKTQVLLLHSQQDKLEMLSAGFNERFSVHFATSGSEALSTLAETPIHVIVSAQNLPGMSGIEALREARRRLPDMVGILLAGDDDDAGAEALVGEHEMFQVVHGNIEPQDLLRVVESAARKGRVLKMAESANDNVAEAGPAAPATRIPDPRIIEETGEHVVMETMENGAAVVTDGSQRLLALNTGLANAAPNASAGPVGVMVLSQDGNFIAAVRAAAKGLHPVHQAETPQQALDTLAGHSVGVLVTDAAVGGNNIALLMQELRKKAPRLVGIVAGRRDDGESLMELINRGHIYRFLLKPLSPGRARLAIEASAKYHVEAPDAAFKVRQQATPVANNSAARPAPPAEAAPAAAALRRTARVPHDALAQTQASPAPVPTGKRPVTFIGGAVLLLAAAGAATWFFTDNAAFNVAPIRATTTPAQTLPAPTAPARSDIVVSTPAETPEPAYINLLDNARFARDSGRVLAPPGDNAIEWYVQARAAEPDNVIIRDELAVLLEQVIGRAETALLENRRADAEAALAMIALADPANPRLAFINAQLDQALLHETLDAGRAAIRDARFEDAGRLLAQAAGIPGADAAVIDQLTEDLAKARSAQRLDDVLARANERIGTGQLTTPPNDNARYFFELAASIEPGNTAAQQGLLVVASKLVLKARASIDAGAVDSATVYLREARELDANSPEIAATEAALRKALEPATASDPPKAAATTGAGNADDAQRAVSQATLPASVETGTANPADNENLTPAGAASAAVDNSRNVSAPTPVPPAREARQAAAGSAPESDSAAVKPDDATDPAASRTTDVPAAVSKPQPAQAIAGMTADDGAAVTNDPIGDGAADANAAGSNEIQQVAVSQLTRTHYVAPRYPRNAQRRNVSGWVDIGFTVTSEGLVRDIEILDSAPSKIFNDAAGDAVAKWRFEPPVEDGQAVPRRVALRISFNLE